MNDNTVNLDAIFDIFEKIKLPNQDNQKDLNTKIDNTTGDPNISEIDDLLTNVMGPIIDDLSNINTEDNTNANDRKNYINNIINSLNDEVSEVSEDDSNAIYSDGELKPSTEQNEQENDDITSIEGLTYKININKLLNNRKYSLASIALISALSIIPEVSAPIFFRELGVTKQIADLFANEIAGSAINVASAAVSSAVLALSLSLMCDKKIVAKAFANAGIILGINAITASALEVSINFVAEQYKPAIYAAFAVITAVLDVLALTLINNSEIGK